MAHPNLVTVFDFDYHSDGSPYIAMELLKGSDLQKAVRQPPPMTVERKVAVIVQVLAGLAHAHQAGIVHRDIKPANILIQEDGSVKIMDFGVARLTTASMTGTGNIVGTADYMSPEQVKGAKVDGA
jgi:serine/threonine-protein kinase